MKIKVNSEIGKLEGVIIHSPGQEVENMTPQNAERALYSDILNLSVASAEYDQFKQVLSKVTKTYEAGDLLSDILSNEKAKTDLLTKIAENEDVPDLLRHLEPLSRETLTRQLIEGVPLKPDTLTRFLSKEKFILQPLHNFFFTRDSAVCIDQTTFISRLSNRVREREAIIMSVIMEHHPEFNTRVINPSQYDDFNPDASFEGGDILVAREDIVLMGTGVRSSTHGVDFILDRLKESAERKHLIVQVLPEAPESFIHLDMVFTLLDKDLCMVYAPVVIDRDIYPTVHIIIEKKKVVSIREVKDIPTVLNKLGMAVKPIFCGGQTDRWTQEREQWHSGANFLALAPGKVISYDRNMHTLEELSQLGYEIVTATRFLEDNLSLDDFQRCIITIEGSELARGGGGSRCMTFPINRQPVQW
ncbi:MAG: arginine deiminase [Calditrichales bacterium]|nr:MAG: arginine deiminase [Calditrichales bacterium]